MERRETVVLTLNKRGLHRYTGYMDNFNIIIIVHVGCPNECSAGRLPPILRMSSLYKIHLTIDCTVCPGSSYSNLYSNSLYKLSQLLTGHTVK